jgi:hypothetical protein
MSSNTYTCPWHQAEIERGNHCPACLERYAALPDPKAMTIDERVAELEDWYDKAILTIPMGTLSERIDGLVGRGVWTHELVNREALIREIRSGQEPSFEEVLDKIPADKQVIVVSPD